MFVFQILLRDYSIGLHIPQLQEFFKRFVLGPSGIRTKHSPGIPLEIIIKIHLGIWFDFSSYSKRNSFFLSLNDSLREFSTELFFYYYLIVKTGEIFLQECFRENLQKFVLGKKFV